MERTQKQITGRAPVPYSWDNGQYSRARYQTSGRDAFRVERVPTGKKHTKKQTYKDKARLVLLEIATIAILVLMLSMVIGKLNHIADIKSEYDIIEEVKKKLVAEVNNAQTEYSGLITANAVEYVARTQLNMMMPNDTDVHVLSSVTKITSDTIHTAEAGVRP